MRPLDFRRRRGGPPRAAQNNPLVVDHPFIVDDERDDLERAQCAPKSGTGDLLIAADDVPQGWLATMRTARHHYEVRLYEAVSSTTFKVREPAASRETVLERHRFHAAQLRKGA